MGVDYLAITMFAVAVVPGRTRTLVERFERREKFNANEDKAADVTPHQTTIATQNQSTNMITNDTIYSTSIQPSMTATPPSSIMQNQQTITTRSQASNVTSEPTIYVTSIPPTTPNQATSTVPKQPTGVALNQPITMTRNRSMSMTRERPTSMILNLATHVTPTQAKNMMHHVVPERDTIPTTLVGFSLKQTLPYFQDSCFTS